MRRKNIIVECLRYGFGLLIVFAGLISIVGTGGGGGGTDSSPGGGQASGIALIGPEGGTIEIKEQGNALHGCKIIIPANALSSKTEISVSGERNYISENDVEEVLLNLLPHQTQFLRPVKVEVPFNVAALSKNQYVYALNLSDGEIKKLDVKILNDSMVEVELTHFSTLSISSEKEIYIILEIPPTHLKSGDIIYCMTGENEIFDWFPGHAGMIFGENSIIESTPYKNCTDLFPANPECLGVKLSNWDSDFVEPSIHLYMGARRPIKYDVDIANKAVDFAVDHIGYRWEALGSSPNKLGSYGDGFSCVGLVEAAYEDAGTNIVYWDGFGLFFIPLHQFNKTIPVDEITIEVGKTISLPVKAALKNEAGKYIKEISKYSAELSFNPNNSYLSADKIFYWSPTCENHNKNYPVKFTVKAVDENDNEIEDSQVIDIKVPYDFQCITTTIPTTTPTTSTTIVSSTSTTTIPITTTVIPTTTISSSSSTTSTIRPPTTTTSTSSSTTSSTSSITTTSTTTTTVPGSNTLRLSGIVRHCWGGSIPANNKYRVGLFDGSPSSSPVPFASVPVVDGTYSNLNYTHVEGPYPNLSLYVWEDDWPDGRFGNYTVCDQYGGCTYYYEEAYYGMVNFSWNSTQVQWNSSGVGFCVAFSNPSQNTFTVDFRTTSSDCNCIPIYY